jgi:UDP-glucose 6-dehydrogenase
VFTNIETAEVTKYAGNAFLATKITFINEIADLCEKVGADVHEVAGLTIGVLGLTFKPNTDDMRDAPSLDIVSAVEEAGAQIVAFDPEGMKEAARLMPTVTYAESAYDAVLGADVLVVITEWPEFRGLDPRRLMQLMPGRASSTCATSSIPKNCSAWALLMKGWAAAECTHHL